MKRQSMHRRRFPYQMPVRHLSFASGNSRPIKVQIQTESIDVEEKIADSCYALKLNFDRLVVTLKYDKCLFKILNDRKSLIGSTSKQRFEIINHILLPHH